VWIVRGIDGDTVLVLLPLGFGVSIEKSVRLRGIESWELNSPDADRARLAARAITERCQMKLATLTLTQRGPDLHGRLVGSLTVDGHDLATWLVTRGLAWYGPPGTTPEPRKELPI
jgi:endonuclease YncB( thermonuclease family)